jgi:hypothetical protein
MSESDTLPQVSGDEKQVIGPLHISVGIPQGVLVDQGTGEIAGAVRRGGELVSLDRVEYGIWSLLLTPMTLAMATDVASSSEWGNLEQTIARLRKLDLLVGVEAGKSMDSTLGRLRPISLGVGLGNNSGDPTRFEIQNAALSLPEPVSLDVVGVMFWWEFDGTRSLREIVGRVVARLPNLSADLAWAVATQLACGLMASRLLYLDLAKRIVACPFCATKQRIQASATKYKCGKCNAKVALT